MSYILNIETSTTNCSVSLFYKDELISSIENNDDNYSHSEMLHQNINSVVINSNILLKDLSAISVSKGPGSYTGLRIGVSSAKGLCYALKIPLISINTLDAFSHKIQNNDGFIIPLIDARRMEVYSSVYNKKHDQLRDVRAEILDESSFIDFLNKGRVYFIGNSNYKTIKIIKHENAVFINNKFPSSKQMGKLSFKKFKNKTFESTADFEPFYLKEFIGKKLQV